MERITNLSLEAAAVSSLTFVLRSEDKESIVEVINGFVEISLTEIWHPGPPLQVEALLLKHTHCSLHLVFKGVPQDRHFFRRFVTWDRFHIRSEGKDKGYHE